MTEPGRWPEGAAVIESMIDDGDLEKVAPSRAHSQRLLAEAERHLGSVELLADADPPLAYDSLYAAARKSLAAVLAVQGLRSTSRGGHLAAQHAIEAQLGRMRHVVRAFNRLRITRNESGLSERGSPAALGRGRCAKTYPRPLTLWTR